MLKKMVVNALGMEAKDAEQRVTVQEMTFEKPAEDPNAKKGGLAAGGAGGTDWLDMGRKAITILIAVGIFVMFLNMLKKQKTETSSVEVMEEKTVTSSGQASLTPDVLNTMIQQRPENVSAALKTWVSASTTKQ